MGRYEAVHREGWQAFGAVQALLSREAALKDLTLNELQSLFRHAASPPAPPVMGGPSLIGGLGLPNFRSSNREIRFNRSEKGTDSRCERIKEGVQSGY